MHFDLVVRNGQIVTAETTYEADVGIKEGRIAALGADLQGEQAIDASGKLVVPGAVDIHVHLEMPIGPFTSADDFFDGTRAAAFGGTTTVIDFVETDPNETMLEALAARRALAEARATIDYSFHMTIGPGDMGRLDQLAGVVAAGCPSFKLYMAYAMSLDDAQLLQALIAVAEVAGLPVVHAENWDVICSLVAQNLAAGRNGPRWHPRSRPPQMEGEAAGRVIDIAAMAGTPLHIFHVSCADVVERIRQARRHGLPVTGETCPQYLVLTQDLYDRPGVEGALPVCAPPLREAGHQAALWRALADGDLQLVTTDHCPFTRAEKAGGLENFSQIPGGVPSIESRLGIVYQGVRTGHFSENRWVDLCATTPARLLGFTNKGVIDIGYDADVVVFDPTRRRTIMPEMLHESAGWTPYEGMTLQGWPEYTISRGEVIVAGDTFRGQKGRGAFVRRSLASTPAS